MSETNKQYRICTIHAELLERLSKGQGMIYYIDDVSVLKKKINYRRYNEEHPIVKFVQEQGIELMADVPNDKYKRADADLYNTIAIRELINNLNGWRLSCFIKDMFSLAIWSGLESLKHDKKFGGFYKLCLQGLSRKAYLIYEAEKSGRTPTVNDYVNDDIYLMDCNGGAAQRWENFKFVHEQYAIQKKQYMRMDLVFGMGDIYYDFLSDYSEYILEYWKQWARENCEV